MKLTVSHDSFTKMLQGLVASGCTFDAVEKDGNIVITFNGGY